MTCHDLVCVSKPSNIYSDKARRDVRFIYMRVSPRQ